MWNGMLTRFFNTVMKNQRGQIHKHRALSTTVFKLNKNELADAFDINLLSSEDKEKILEVINTKATTDLLKYSITKNRAEKLELLRANNGPFESLDDLLQIQSMNNKWVFNFYKSILCGKKKPPKKIIPGLIATPQNTGNQKDVNTVLGIYVGHDLVSWSLLNRDCEVSQWGYKSFPRKGTKETIHTLLQETIPIARKLPKADRYVMQEANGDIGHVQNRHLHQDFVQRSIIGAIILSYLTLLDSRFNDTTTFVANNIFILRQRVLLKIYGLIIDNEAISTQYMLQKLLQESEELIETKEPKVLIGPDLRNMYNAQSSVCKEQIGWSLLIALAFIELIVHKRTDMILRERESPLNL
ncbi:PREDICTED: transcription elongation factor, mitochondrial [Vollenhovia emeryi]|uniref:transcription elongation factor, mitochondrial n=1 Tax=Vollenhovia emeryi TaxID=411798 RepID=UPI0005F4D1C9|nr:PREDICTED: transcription elongation factor, mitochondrial [Vollenhovia emeryi]